MTERRQPGWYPDPDHPGQMRWWDGSDWRGQGAAVGPASASSPDSFAIVSLCSALLFIPVVPVVFGVLAQRRIRASGGTRDGEGIALIGIALGLIELIAAVVLLAVLLVAA